MSLYILGMVFALLLFASCGAGAFRTATEPRVSEASQRARAVAIYFACPAPEHAGAGSGLFVGPNRVLTAAHVVSCLAPGAEFYVRDTFGTVRAAKIEWISPGADIALLEVAGDPTDFHMPVIAPVEPGSTVCIVAEIPTTTRQCGTVLGIRGQGGANVAHTARVVPGNSGSGVYDMNGRLVGIVTHKTPVGGLFTSLAGRRGLP